VRRLVALAGLPGSGKSTLARALAERFNYAWVRSDAVRKELAGRSPYEKLEERFYDEQFTERVYEELLRRAGRLIKEGRPVVLDATFSKRRWREVLKKTFPEVLLVWLTVRPEEAVRRLRTRGRDVSDADEEVFKKLLSSAEPPEPGEAVFLDANGPKEEVFKRLTELLSDEGLPVHEGG